MRPAAGCGQSIVCLESSGVLAERLRGFVRNLDNPSEFGFSCAPSHAPGVVALCERLRPTLLVVQESDFEGLPLEAMRDGVNRGDVRILVLSKAPSDVVCESLLRKGCSGVLSAEVGDTTLRKAIHAIFAGELWAPRRVLSSFAKETLSRDRSRELTQRESDIHKLICLGLTNQQIADQLFISRETVRWHVRSLYAKLGVPNQRRAMLETGRLRGPSASPVAIRMEEATLS